MRKPVIFRGNARTRTDSTPIVRAVTTPEAPTTLPPVQMHMVELDELTKVDQSLRSLCDELLKD